MINFQLDSKIQKELDQCVEKAKQSDFINQAVLVALQKIPKIQVTQSSIFQSAESKTYSVFSDGGARGNPGIAGCGVVIFDEKKQKIAELKQRISHATNNEAEYTALLLGAKEVVKFSPKKVIFYLDSELVVKQMQGVYKIKKAELGAIYLKIQTVLQQIPHFSFVHIPREKNKLADRLANEAMDEA